MQPMPFLCLVFLVSFCTLLWTPLMHYSGNCWSKMSALKVFLFYSSCFFDAAHSQNFWSFLYSRENFHCSVERCLWEVYDIFQALQNMAVNHGHTNLLEPQLLYYRKLIIEISFKVSPNYPSLHISKYLSSFRLLFSFQELSPYILSISPWQLNALSWMVVKALCYSY